MLKEINKYAPVLGLLIFLVSIGTISITARIADPLLWASAIFGVLLFLTIFIQGVSQNFSHYVSNFLYLLFVLGTVVMLFEISQNRHREWDLTQNKVHSLFPPVQEYLQNLQTRVHIIAFTSEADSKYVANELRRYTAFGKSLTFETADPFRDVLTIAQLKVLEPDLTLNTNETMVLRYAVDPETNQPLNDIVRQIKITGIEEEQLINGVIQVVNDRRYNLYFLQDHHELDIESEPSEDNQRTMFTLRNLLAERGFYFRPLNLRTSNVIPADCDILVCVSPLEDLWETEVETLSNYLGAGGKAMFLLDPPINPQIQLTNFSQLLRRFGVNAQTDQLIVDNNATTQYTRDPLLFPIVQYANNPLVRDLGLSGSTFQVNVAMPLFPVAGAEASGFVYQDLLFSGKNSWSISALQLQQLSSDSSASQLARGVIEPRSIAAVVSKGITGPGDERGMKMLVMGDGTCFEDQNLKRTQAIMFFNIVNWMIEGPSTVAIPPRRPPNTPKTEIDPFQQRLLLGGTVFILPSLIFFGGLGYFILRRRTR